ncbi:MAG: substrate-binding domain-containing protein [Zavarzinella sp.]
MFRWIPWLIVGLSVAGLIVLIFLLPSPPANEDSDGKPVQKVVVLAAPSVRGTLEKAAAEFTKEYGIPIEISYEPSESLLNTLSMKKTGDLFLPADESFVARARESGLVTHQYDLAQLTAVAVSKKGSPAPTWEWIQNPERKVGIPDTKITAIGKLLDSQMAQLANWQALNKKRTVTFGTITQALNAVQLGSVDATFVWDALIPKDSDLKSAVLPGMESCSVRIAVSLCTNSAAPQEARSFALYLSQRSGGQKFFREAGYAPTQPEKISLKPGSEDSEILLYSGSMLRPAIEKTIAEFEKREKVRVTVVYNGCGILVGQMKAGKQPDVYLACDHRFMDEVQDQFYRPQQVSNNQLVIAVPKGNPHQIKQLKDLGKPGLRVGVGHEQQCAMGNITKETFKAAGVYAAVRNNVRVETPTGDMLVNQLVTGSLDAVVCYATNVLPNQAKLDSIPVNGIPCAKPLQPIAIAKSTHRPDLAAKLVDLILSQQSQQRFLESGFGWEGVP